MSPTKRRSNIDTSENPLLHTQGMRTVSIAAAWRDASQTRGRQKFTVKYLPLITWLVYSAFSVASFALGPIIYELRAPALLYGYLAAVHLAIIWGYATGTSRIRVAASNINTSTLVLVLGTISSVGLLVALIGDFRAGLSIGNTLSDAEGARRIWREDRGGTVTMYIGTLLGGAHLPLLGLTISHWRLLPRSRRLLGLLPGVGIVLMSFIGGSRAGIYAVLAVAFIAAAAGKYSGQLPVRRGVFAAVGGGCIFLFLFYSSFVTVVRDRAHAESYVTALFERPDLSVKRDVLPLIELAPVAIQPGIVSGLINVSHGYAGLAQSLDLPFYGVGCGIGHSSVLMRNAQRLLDDTRLYRYSYFERLVLEENYSPSLWITAYPWVASDVTFTGSVLVWFLIGRLTAQAWLSVLRSPDALAATALAWLFYTLAMTPMNFPPGDIGALPSFYGCTGTWLWFSARRRERAAR